MRRRKNWLVHAETFLALLLLFVPSLHLAEKDPDDLLSTFSIVAYDPDNKEWGVAVQSKFFNAAAIVPWAKAGVGAIATQAFANYSYGPEGLKLLEQGLSASDVVKRLTEADAERDRRQLAVIDARGAVETFTGSKCTPWAGAVKGKYFSAQGNILVGQQVVQAMGKAFEETRGDLADRLVAALAAGQAAGGDARGKQSAGLLVVRAGAGFAGTDRYIDLRVDDHPEPIEELQRLLRRYRLTLKLYRAFSLEQEGKITEAIRLVREVVEKDPQDGDVHYRLAALLARTGDKPAALAELEKALTLNRSLALLVTHNPAFDSLKNEPAYQKLMAGK